MSSRPLSHHQIHRTSHQKDYCRFFNKEYPKWETPKKKYRKSLPFYSDTTYKKYFKEQNKLVYEPGTYHRKKICFENRYPLEVDTRRTINPCFQKERAKSVGHVRYVNKMLTGDGDVSSLALKGTSRMQGFRKSNSIIEAKIRQYREQKFREENFQKTVRKSEKSQSRKPKKSEQGAGQGQEKPTPSKKQNSRKFQERRVVTQEAVSSNKQRDTVKKGSDGPIPRIPYKSGARLSENRSSQKASTKRSIPRAQVIYNPINNCYKRIKKNGQYGKLGFGLKSLSPRDLPVTREALGLGKTMKKKIDFKPSAAPYQNREFFNGAVFDRKKKFGKVNASSPSINQLAGMFDLPKGRKLFHKGNFGRECAHFESGSLVPKRSARSNSQFGQIGDSRKKDFKLKIDPFKSYFEIV